MMTGILFIVVWILGVCSWLIAIFEMISVHSFWRFAFKMGIPVKKISLETESNNFEFPANRTIKMDEGKFLFTNDRKVYFLSQLFLFRFRLSTPFPFRGIATLQPDNKIDIIATIPIGPTLFFLFWILGWTFGSIGLGLQSGDFSSIGFALIGWLFAGVIFGISYPVEKRRFDTMISELKQIVSVHNKKHSTLADNTSNE